MTKFTFNYSELFQTAKANKKAEIKAFAENFFTSQGAKFDGFELVFFNVYGVGEEDESVYFTVAKADGSLVDVEFLQDGEITIREDLNKSGLTGKFMKCVVRDSLLACDCVEKIEAENLDVAGEMSLAQAVEILGAKSKYTMAHVNKLVKSGTLSVARAISLTMQVAEECGGAIAKTLVLELVKVQKAEAEAQAETEQEIERLYAEVDSVLEREIAQEIAQATEPTVSIESAVIDGEINVTLHDCYLFENGDWFELDCDVLDYLIERRKQEVKKLFNCVAFRGVHSNGNYVIFHPCTKFKGYQLSFFDSKGAYMDIARETLDELADEFADYCNAYKIEEVL